MRRVLDGFQHSMRYNICWNLVSKLNLDEKIEKKGKKYRLKIGLVTCGPHLTMQIYYYYYCPPGA